MNSKLSLSLVFAVLISVAMLTSCNEKVSKEEPAKVKEVNKEELSDSVNAFMDEWHKDAANARPAFFNKMADNGIYIGTDKTELWEKDEFQSWSKQYFDRGAAWDFTPVERNVYFSENGEYAWFDELLDTWMGVCRSSGVLHSTEDGWKIEHYQLSVTVPNDAVEEFLKVIDNYENSLTSDSIPGQ